MKNKLSHQEKLAKIGEACIDWWLYMKEYHFCTPQPNWFNRGDNEEDPDYEHDEDCLLIEILGKKYFDNLKTMKDIIQ